MAVPTSDEPDDAVGIDSTATGDSGAVGGFTGSQARSAAAQRDCCHIWPFLAVACGYCKTRHACDVKTAFLHSDLQPHEQIPIRLPDGMEVHDEDGSTLRYVILYDNSTGHVLETLGYYKNL